MAANETLAEVPQRVSARRSHDRASSMSRMSARRMSAGPYTPCRPSSEPRSTN